MYKAISILVLGAVFAACLLCSCDADKSEELTTDINDKVISAIDKSSPITDGNLITKTNTDDDGNINIDYFDNKGNLVEQFVWQDESTKSHTVMKYSEDNKVMSKEEISPDGQSNVVYSYQYDSDNNITGTTVSTFSDGMLKKSSTCDSDDNVTSNSYYFYDDSKNLTKIERRDSNDALIEYFEYTYDTDGQKSKYSSFAADGAIKKYTLFEYNDKSQLIQEKYFDSSDVMQYRFVYEYFDSGNMKSSTQYDSNDNIVSQDTFQDISD